MWGKISLFSSKRFPRVAIYCIKGSFCSADKAILRSTLGILPRISYDVVGLAWFVWVLFARTPLSLWANENGNLCEFIVLGGKQMAEEEGGREGQRVVGLDLGSYLAYFVDCGTWDSGF